MVYTIDTLPSNIPALRTGTANDGRMLIRATSPSSLEDVRRRLPLGWTAEMYAPSGIDIVITHVGA